MGQAIGNSLPAAVGVAISPLPIVAVVLMLVSREGRVNGPAFVVGWLLGVGVVGTVVLLVASGADASKSGQPADWVSWLKLVLGVLLLLVAARQFRVRPRDASEVVTPKWMSTVDGFTPVRAFAVGVALAAVNPKNLLLVVAGAAAIAGTGISTGEQVVAFIVFAVIATVGVGAPVVLYFGLGERSRTILEELKTWMTANNTVIMAVLLLILGWKLIGDGISGLS
jgi:threonine/homoserine/homoserine lactone efflux protein